MKNEEPPDFDKHDNIVFFFLQCAIHCAINMSFESMLHANHENSWIGSLAYITAIKIHT